MAMPVKETRADLPDRKWEDYRSNPRDLTLDAKQMALVFMAHQKGRAWDRGMVAKRVGPGEVKLSYYVEGKLRAEVITVPDEIVVRSYQAKVGG